MGRGILSGRVPLLLRSTEIWPHRPNDLLPLFFFSETLAARSTKAPLFLPSFQYLEKISKLFTPIALVELPPISLIHTSTHAPHLNKSN